MAVTGNSGVLWIGIQADTTSFKQTLQEVEKLSLATGQKAAEIFNGAFSVDTAGKALEQCNTYIEALSEHTWSASDRLEAFEDSVTSVIYALEKKNSMTESGLTILSRETSIIQEQAASYSRLAESAREAAEAGRAVGDQTTSSRDETPGFQWNISERLQTGLQKLQNRAEQESIDFFENGIPNALSTSAKAVGTFSLAVLTSSTSIGEAWKNLGKTFQNVLNQLVSDMTSAFLKMALFGGSGGGLFGSLFNGLFGGESSISMPTSAPAMATDSYYKSWGGFHLGGIVGSAPMTMAVPASVFSGAGSYHAGGIAGLKADEVPTILKKGEEVLAATDPRHRYNSAGIAAPVSVNVNVATPAGCTAEVSERENATGGTDIEILVKELDHRLASRISNNTSSIDRGIASKHGTNYARRIMN